MTERTYRLILTFATLFLAAWIAWPFFFYTQRAGYEGLVPMRTGDEGAYEDRIQTALLGRYDEVDNGITSPGIHGVGSSSVELVTGWVLRGNGLHGPEAAMVLMIFIAPLFFVFFTLFLRSLGAARGLSLLLTAAYTVVFLAGLQRPVNNSFTLPFTALTLLLFNFACSNNPKRSFVRTLLLVAASAVSLAVLPNIYFWAWTFLWAGVGCMYLLHHFIPASDAKRTAGKAMTVIAAIGVVLTLPILFHTWLMQVTSPFYAEVASYRSGVYPSHWIESPPRSLLLLLLTIAAATLFVRYKEKRLSLRIPVGLVIGIFIAMHQNIIHGKDLMFESHYYPFVCLAAVTMSAWVLTFDRPSRPFVFRRQWPSALILFITAVFVAAGLWDYRMTWSLPTAPADHLVMEHLAPVLRQLDDGKRQVVLTDDHTALMVKAWTDDDVVFTPYVQSLLVSDNEYIRRSCLSQIFSPTGPDVEAIARELTQYRGQKYLPMREAQVRAVCAPLFANPVPVLKMYHVDLLLWNETQEPGWNINRRYFTKMKQGNGWSLWEING